MLRIKISLIEFLGKCVVKCLRTLVIRRITPDGTPFSLGRQFPSFRLTGLQAAPPRRIRLAYPARCPEAALVRGLAGALRNKIQRRIAVATGPAEPFRPETLPPTCLPSSDPIRANSAKDRPRLAPMPLETISPGE